MELPKNITKGEITTLIAGILTAVVFKRVIGDLGDFIYNNLASFPEWAITVGLIVGIYLLFRYN